ncbi:MAG: amino acid--tRNA ligase-related protein, partial [Candidatus Nanohaloarchaea archaeon]
MAEKIERNYTEEVLEEEEGKKVLLKGWVHETRDLGKIRFLVLRDKEGRIQITAPEKKVDDEIFEAMETSRESVISVKGEVKKSGKAPGGKEVIPEQIEILAEANHPLPIDVSDFSKTELPKRLDYRFLDLHRDKTQAIFKIQSVISMSFREYFSDKGYMEMQPPSVISSASEGGTDLFSVNYFDEEAYLAQSPQLYKQMLACSI